MVTEEQLQEIVRRIVVGYQPDRVILFGSYAYGTPTEDSDVDLLVIKADDERMKIERIVAIREAAYARNNPPMDVLVLNRVEEARVRQSRFLVESCALQQGKILYDAAKRS